MRRKLLTAVALMVSAIAVCRAGEDTGYRVKAMVVRSEEKRMEGKFVVIPEDLRIVCHGDTAGIAEGDYVKVEFKSGRFVAGKMVCVEMKWYR